MSDNPTKEEIEKEIPRKATLPEDEQLLLDTALQESDQLLARSLHDDQRRRFRRRLIWSLTLVMGGIVMSLIVIAIMAGWFAVSTPVTADADKAWPETTDEQWQERLSAVKQSDPWNVGAEIGMDLVRIPGDRPYKILAANWKRIPSSARKQILKGFTPGMMGNKKTHSRFFDVMHLGMSDSDAGVRGYAATYIEMQGLPNFEHDPKGYARWRMQNKGRSAQEIVDDVKLAAPDTNQRADLRTENADTLAAAGWQLWQQRNFSAATGKFEAAVRLDPQAANAWNGLGWSRFNGGESEQAVAAFEKCVALQPRHPAALNGLGQIYLMWKQYAEAEKYLLLAAPQAPAAWYGLARLYLLEEKFSEAKPWIEKIVAQNPGDKNVQRMANAAAARKLDEELRRLIEPPGKPRANSADATRGWAMFQQGKMRTAERLFRRALKADAENLSALNGLAFCLLNQGKHEQAQPLFEKYLAKEKDAPGPMNGLARCLKANGKVDEAIAIWERMIDSSPGPNAATTGLAQTYLERKQYAKAARHFQELVDADPDNTFFRRGLENAERGLAENE